MAGSTAPSLAAAAESLWSVLAPGWPGFSVEILPEIDSTNTELMRRARAGRTEPVLLVAERQTAGRGRMGRAWTSAPGDSLTFSIGVPLSPAGWAGLSLAVGVALAEALEGYCGGVSAAPHIARTRIALKWPNDLWLRGAEPARKLSGILVETAGAATPDAPRYLVVGIGINLQAPPAQGLSTPPAGLRELVPGAQAGAVLHAVLPPLMDALRTFEQQGFGPWHERFAARDALHGHRVRLSDGREGDARGVNLQGELLVHTEAGLQVVNSAEVSVRPQGAAGSTGA